MRRWDALLSAVEDWWETERHRLVLWLPVCMGAGVLTYYELRFEPPLWWGGAVAVPATVLAVALRRFLIARLLLLPIAAAAIGFTSAQFATARGPPIETGLPSKAAIVTATVRAVEALPDGRRILLEQARLDDAPAPLVRHVRVRLRKTDNGPLATGENLFSMQDARNLIRHGGMRADRDWLQFDCALSYGLVEYMRTLDMLRQHAWSPRRCVPHGGHQMSLNIAAGLGLGGNESYPDVFQPFGGFADGTPVENSYVTMPDVPGVGFEAKSKLHAVMKRLADG